MARILIAPVVCAVLLAACAHAPRQPSAPRTKGNASWRAVFPEGTARYRLAMGEVSSGAAPDRRVNPVYPPALLGRCPPPVEVRALLVVNAAGKVDDVRIADGADADRRLYAEAVKAAASQWSFVPLKVDRWAADANGDTHVVDSEYRPFSLTYDFRFECHGVRRRSRLATFRQPPVMDRNSRLLCCPAKQASTGQP